MLAIRLPEELEKRLADMAKRTGRTRTFYAREAIAAYLDDLEDIYLADKELRQVREGSSAICSLEEAMREHGLED